MSNKEEKELKKHLKTLEKDKIIELYLQMKFERDMLDSDHNLLIDGKEQQYNDLTKQIRYESDARKRLVKELALYKKALELACKEIEAHEQGKTFGWLKIQKIKNKFGIDDYKSYYDVFLQKAKEQINGV